jgi:hypothetical protein
MCEAMLVAKPQENCCAVQKNNSSLEWGEHRRKRADPAAPPRPVQNAGYVMQ